MSEFEAEKSWWGKLSSKTRAALLADPDGPVPADMVSEIAAAGGLVSHESWAVPAPDLPEDYVLHKDFQAFLHRVASGVPGL
jgi:hypothetical protein